MEFHEKLQQLRIRKNLTQEQLAAELYVSRAAISKWESGKGYPNIDSLKRISKFFLVTIDELLSGDERISLAQTENHAKERKTHSLLHSALDLTAIAFILLPLYPNRVDGFIYSVNLLSFKDTTPFNFTVYWTVFIAMLLLGIGKWGCTYFEKLPWGYILTKISLVLNIGAVIFFAAAREPYVTALLFLIFIMKMFLLLKQSNHK